MKPTAILASMNKEHQLYIMEMGEHGVEALDLFCCEHGYIGMPMSMEDEPKYRLALHHVMDAGSNHVGEEVHWRAPDSRDSVRS